MERNYYCERCMDTGLVGYPKPCPDCQGRPRDHWAEQAMRPAEEIADHLGRMVAAEERHRRSN